MQCPSCNAELAADEVPIEHLRGRGDGTDARRLSRFANCKCGAVCSFGAWEGWERWYLKSWSAPSARADVREPIQWKPGPDYEAFYAREREERELRGTGGDEPIKTGPKLRSVN